MSDSRSLAFSEKEKNEVADRSAMNFQQERRELSIVRKTKGRIPDLPFSEVKDAILGKDYELSLVFPNLKESEKLHIQWKGEKGPVNILSFPLSENEGEMFITLAKARTEAKEFGMSYREYLLFLFIHGCLHLKGMDHGAMMEEKERYYFERYRKEV